MNFEPVLLSPVLEEIEKLLQKSPKMKKDAAYALRLTEKCKMIRAGVDEMSTDDFIVEVAREWRSPVFTNDKQLRKKLRDINVPVIYVRQKSRLEIDGRV